MKRVSIKSLYLLGIIAGGMTLLGVGSSYALFTSSSEISSPITFVSSLYGEADIIDTVSVTVESGNSTSISLTVKNDTTSKINYSAWYSYSGSDVLFGIDSNMNGLTPTGSLSSSGTGKIYVVIKNNSSSSKTILLGVSSSKNSIVLSNDMQVIPNSTINS